MAASQLDLVVIGAGSGGIATAIRSARHGARVALIESGALGGTCVNVGCVPKKAMWLAAELADAQRIAKEVGFALTPGALDWCEFVRRRDGYISNIHASYCAKLKELGVRLVDARARFATADCVVAGDDAFSAPHIVIATGARPQRPAAPGAQLGIDSDGFFALRSLPRRIAIVGGGYIAVELAGVLQTLGAQVSIFARGARLLGAFDHELTDALAQMMRSRGVDLRLRENVDGATRDDDGYALTLGSGARATGYDELIWATGRAPNSGDMGLDNIGVRLDAQGYVIADTWQDTNVAGIHALGDVTGQLALTPVAVAAGRKLADRLFGGMPESRLDYVDVPTVVFSHPPLATVGCSEEEARRRYGDDTRVYRTRFRPMLAALGASEYRTFMKLVCAGEDERVVGIHILGQSADEMLQGFAFALKAGARKRDLDATVAIHPTSAEELVLMSEPGVAFVGAAD
ncbi:MAG: glutathione-disulfide reductase [Dokdonella sp.]|uniref:glutathione-disulfide reductase n=1 Tax=Dokdonella sp. TaxID=2291710 RepID=UPI0032643774